MWLKLSNQSCGVPQKYLKQVFPLYKTVSSSWDAEGTSWLFKMCNSFIFLILNKPSFVCLLFYVWYCIVFKVLLWEGTAVVSQWPICGSQPDLRSQACRASNFTHRAIPSSPVFIAFQISASITIIWSVEVSRREFWNHWALASSHGAQKVFTGWVDTSDYSSYSSPSSS